MHLDRFCLENRTIAALGATIFLVSPIGIVSNHYVKEDVPVMFMTNLVMLLILMLIEAKKTALYLLTGIVSGIAIGTKIIATSLIPIVLFAHVLSSRHPGKPIRKYATRNFGLMLALIPVGFFLVNPQILFQFGDFLSDYRYQLSYAVSEHHDGTRYSPWDFFWSFQFRYGLVPGFSAVIAVAGLLGIFLCLRNISCSFQKNKPLAIYIVWVVGFYILIESSPIKPHPWQVRYVLPAVPGFSLFAGYAIFIMARYLGKSRIGLGGASFAVLLILLVPTTHSAIIVSGYKTDTIEVGRKWVRENLSSELKIVEDSRDKSFTDSKVVRINSGKRPCGLQKPIEKQAENFTNDIYVTNSTRWIRYFRAEVNNTNINADCYRWIFDRCPLIWEIGPEFPIQSIGYHNPQIKIFDLRQCRTNDRY